MTDEKPRAPTWADLVGFISNLGSEVWNIISLMIAVSFVVWGTLNFAVVAFKQTFENAAASLSGADELEASVEEIAHDVAVMSATIGQINARLETYHPPQVVNVDTYRSYVESVDGVVGQCARGTACRVCYRVNRTTFGQTCGESSVHRRAVLDLNAQPHLPRVFPGDSTPTGSAPEMRCTEFQLDSRVPNGIAQYTITTQFECEQGLVLQDLPPIGFTVTGKGPPR